MLLSVFFFRNSLQFKKVSLPLQPQTRNNGAIAQLVEQRTENPCVPGSIPGGTTCKKSVVNNLFTTLFFLYRMLPNAFPKEKIIETSSTSLTPGKNLSF